MDAHEFSARSAVDDAKDSKAKPSHEFAAGTGCQSGRELPYQFGQIVSESCD
jgi:hypothetical protein